MDAPIRVGLIRCDTHGAYYAGLFADHDALRLQRPLSSRQSARYSWQTGGAHFYFYTNYASPAQMTVERVDGFTLARVWDEHRDAAECLASVFHESPRVCDRPEQVSDDVDLVLVADCNGDGGDHLALARPGLRKGVPTFVDKPMAFTTEDALEIVQLAEGHAAPLCSISILRVLPVAARFRSRLPEVGPLQFGTIQGGGTTLAGHIHAVSLAQLLFGGGVKSVRCMGETELHTFHLDYGDRPDRPARGVTVSCDVGTPWHCAFHASAYGPGGAVHSPPMSDFDFPFGAADILRKVRGMVHANASPPILRDAVEAVAIAETARRAQASAAAEAVPELPPI